MYGADMDSKNASGNTPLHVCAVNNQEACARMLLFRGASRGALNYANQTPYQVNELRLLRITFHITVQRNLSFKYFLKNLFRLNRLKNRTFRN